MRDEIRQAFSSLHASEHTLEEVFRMIDTRKNTSATNYRRIQRIILAAAISIAALALTAFTVDYVANHREIFFFDTIQELMTKQSETNQENYALYYGVPATMEENKDLETPVEYVDRVMTRGLLDNETVLLEEEDPNAENGWQRRRVAQCQNDLYGDVVTEYLASSSYANKIFVEGLLDWDLRSLSETMTPEEGGQVLVLCRSAADQKLLWVKSHCGYTTESGKRFSVSYAYDVTADYGQEPEYILSSAYDQSEVFVTEDGMESLIMAYDGQVWANTVYGHKYVDIYTTGCTVEEIKRILNNLQLSSVLS